MSSAIGAGAGLVVTGGTSRGLIQGAISGALVSLFVRSAGTAAAGAGVSEWRFGRYLAVKSLLTAAAISAGLAVAALPWLFTEGSGGWRAYVIPFLVAVAASLAFTWWFALDRLLGKGVLVGLLTGRYHQPRREERVVLFADLLRSTTLAERLGEVRYHAFLSRAFADVSPAVERYRGSVYQYVGDQMVVSWPSELGLRDGNCIRCAIEAGDALRERVPYYEREFGTAPRFRFVVHCGPVIVGELGVLRREIVISGDTLNTAGRIETLAKQLDHELVVSEAVVRRSQVPAELEVEPLGVHRLSGREAMIELFAVARSQPPKG